MILYLSGSIGSSFPELPLLLTKITRRHSNINSESTLANLVPSLENISSIFLNHRALHIYKVNNEVVI